LLLLIAILVLLFIYLYYRNGRIVYPWT
jgi:hypothetical protein